MDEPDYEPSDEDMEESPAKKSKSSKGAQKKKRHGIRRKKRLQSKSESIILHTEVEHE